MQENLARETYSLAHNMRVEYHSFLAPNGYTQAAIDNIKSMQSVGINVSLRCVHGKMVGNGFSINEIKWITSLLSSMSLEDDIQFLHAIPTRWKSISLKKRKVALFVFENEKIPELWLSSLRSCEAVIVPSFFNKKSLDNCGVDNVYVIPHSIDSSVWNNNLTMPRSDNGNEIKVITIGTWRKRKNWKQMTLAMCEAIRCNKRIHWTMKIDRSQPALVEIQSWLKDISCLELLNSNIHIDSRVLDENSLARLVSSHDILLSASLGEGFGLPAMQACFAGLLVVCPNYGGYAEFFDQKCYYEIKSSGFCQIDKMDNLAQFEKLYWPTYDKDSILNALYLCMSNLYMSKAIIDIVAKESIKKFNHQAVGLSFLNVLNTINAFTSHKN